MAIFETKFGLGDFVHIDHAKDIVAVVVGINIKDGAPQFEVSWFSNGVLQSAYFSDWRLTQAPQ